jgi:muramoyltetrapeptide carboxypeptidase
MSGTDEKMDEKTGRWNWRTIVEDRVRPIGVPAVYDFPIGHMKTMLSVPLGVRARLDANAGTLTYIESPCS